ncbi:prepilin peptidase [Variovorax sp. UMC13]|uniref:A24 family peptidase n=1 Tax=Variovorax sp. UMC13 TaxID=1862326 RepID=UPI0015FFB51A|nr:A24 family peptidase [Variovorax sp. UMC13]MBB1599329.1 peptidase A24 [Variovorax sp. UMC13]
MTAAVWLLWLLSVASHDFRQRRVPNWLVLLGAAMGAIALGVDAQPFGISWTQAGLGAAGGFCFLLVFYAMGLMGAGDVKFGAALGLWVGLQPLLPIWLAASLLAGAHAVLWQQLQRSQRFPRLAEALSGVSPQHDDSVAPKKRQRHIPFAAYLSIASAGWLLWRGSIL